MAYNYEYPYFDSSQYNDDWLIWQVVRISMEWKVKKKEWDCAIKAQNEAISELREYVDNYFTDLDVRQEINEKIDSMIADGTFERIFGGSLMLYKDINGMRRIPAQKLYTVALPQHHSAQGFCYDGVYYYMLHHQNDDSPLYITRVNAATKESTTTQIAARGHGNCMNWYKGELYVTMNSPSAVARQVLVLDINTLALSRTLTLPDGASFFDMIEFNSLSKTWDCAVYRASGGFELVYFISSAPNTEDYSELMSFATVNSGYYNALRQGGDASGNFLYIPMSIYLGASENVINVYTLTGDLYTSLYIDYPERFEIEDVQRVSGQQLILFNDSSGNIYSMDTEGQVDQDGPTNFQLDGFPMMEMTLFREASDNCVFTGNLMSSFTPIPITRFSNYNTMSILGNFFGFPFHGSFNPFTREISFNGIRINPNDGVIIAVNLIYAFNDDRTYSISIMRVSYMSGGSLVFRKTMKEVLADSYLTNIMGHSGVRALSSISSLSSMERKIER